MTKRICSIGNILMGIMLMIGPWFVFGVCSTEEKVMKCFWSCRSLFALGILAILVGILVLLVKNRKITNEVVISLAISIMSILIPLVIIGGCMKDTMHCRVTTFPVIYAIAGANVLLQLFVLVKELKSPKKR